MKKLVGAVVDFPCNIIHLSFALGNKPVRDFVYTDEFSLFFRNACNVARCKLFHRSLHILCITVAVTLKKPKCVREHYKPNEIYGEYMKFSPGAMHILNVGCK